MEKEVLYIKEIERLRAELLGISEQLSACQKDGRRYAHEYLIAKDALDARQKDAERYAVLRNFGFPNQTSHFGPWWWKDGGLFHTLDEAVDAKIAEMKGEK